MEKMFWVKYSTLTVLCNGKMFWVKYSTLTVLCNGKMFWVKYSTLTVLCNGKMYKTLDKFSTTSAEPGTNTIWELYFLSEEAQFKLSMKEHKQSN